jgi:hypothetical protein
MIDGNSVYLPEKEDWGHLSEVIWDALTVPKRRVARQWGCTKPPYEVCAASWEVQLTEEWNRELFLRLKEAATADMVAYLNSRPELRFYPITREVPRDLYGIAYFDWRGACHPMDVRAVASCETKGDENGYAALFLKFHIATLLEKD